MCYLHNVSGVLTLDINTLTLIQRKTSSLLNMRSGFAITKKNIIVNDERSNLMQKFIYRIQTYTQCTRLHTSSSVPQPQHLVLTAIGSSIQNIQPNTPEDGHVDARIT